MLHLIYNKLSLFCRNLIGNEVRKKKHELPIDDPISSLSIVAKQIGREPLDVPWDDTFFETNPELPLYIYMSYC